ncbi:unnamed protein product [Arctogadus glacialis]
MWWQWWDRGAPWSSEEEADETALIRRTMSVRRRALDDLVQPGEQEEGAVGGEPEEDAGTGRDPGLLDLSSLYSLLQKTMQTQEREAFMQEQSASSATSQAACSATRGAACSATRGAACSATRRAACSTTRRAACSTTRRAASRTTSSSTAPSSIIPSILDPGSRAQIGRRG